MARRLPAVLLLSLLLMHGAFAVAQHLAIPASAKAYAGSVQEKASSVGLPSAKVDAIFQKMDTRVTPGCALSVMRDGKIVYERGYGMANLDYDAPVTPTTVFHVASMSKQFTAASIILLAQQGKLSLDDPVRKYIPELPDYGVPITIRQLMHHTGGLRDQWDLLGLAGWRYSLDLITDDDVLWAVSRQKELNFTPGTRFLYSNSGYTLLAQVVKRISGQSFREFTTTNIFRPLGMNSTHFRDDHAQIVKNFAEGYAPADGKFRISITNFDTVGATSLLTTVEDLARWDQNFYDPRVGGPSLIKQMLEPGKLNNGEQLDYAAGLIIGTYRGLNTVEHAGSDAGYQTDRIRFPNQHFSVACLCNSAATNPGNLARQVAEIYLGKEMKPAEEAPADDWKGVQLTSEQLRSRVGKYLNATVSDQNAAEDDLVTISFKDNKLRAVFGLDDGTYELKALEGNHFRLMPLPVYLTFGPPSSPDRDFRLRHSNGKAEMYRSVMDYKPSEADLSSRAGVYSSEEIDSVYEIKAEKDTLVLFRRRREPDKLLPVTSDLYLGSVGRIFFTRDNRGQISGFRLSTGRVQNLRFEKVQRDIPPVAP